jgi:iron complex outermembrane receptor protein
MITRHLATALLVVLAGTVVQAGQPATAASGTGVPTVQPPPPPPQPPQPPTPPPEKKAGEEQELPRYEEQVIVTASKAEQRLINAPATVSLISGQALESAPSQSYADLFRTVPGLNVTQTSARDINLTSRSATSTLSTGQLALLDGRSIYQDFFGFVAWDFLPVSFDEIKQIEIIRGPASAIWGANALTGVINVITKSPREMAGTSVTIGFGGFDRTVGTSEADAGTLFYINGTHAQAVDDRWSFKVSGGAYTQDPLPRPVGTIPNAFNTPYPAFQNEGTTQPKFDGRVDYDFEDGRKLIFAGGIAGTEGIIHTGIGPFDIEGGTVLGYAKVNYSRAAQKINFFVNFLEGEAPALLSVDQANNPIVFTFSNQTFDFEYGDVRAIGTRHVVSFGGNFRHNAFDLSLAPQGDNRDEVGGYIQDEIFLGDHVRWVVGFRLDKFDIIDNVQFSPRTTLLLKPTPRHTVRVSYNRAYRAPSLVQNFLDVTIRNRINLGLIPGLPPAFAGAVYAFPVDAVGNPDLVEQSITAFEIGYTGVFADRATVTAAWYSNHFKDDIFFTQTGSYSSTNLPPGWPLPPAVLDLLIAGNAFGPGNGLPSVFSYRNLGKVDQTGFELGLDARVTRYLDAFVNYSWQGEPDPTFDLSEVNLPPTHRFNAGVNVSRGRYFGGLSVSYTDEAFWQDVLDARFAGTTDAYTLVNGSFGVRVTDHVTALIKATNLANEEVMQHIFGDVLKRQVVGELRFRF